MSATSAAGPAAPFDATVPLHHQVYLQLRNQIADGLWHGRDDFPGERELASNLGISVITSRAALDRLVADGWIERKRGHRPKVIHSPGRLGVILAPDIFPTGELHPYQYEVLLAESRIAPAEACTAFGLPAGSDLWQAIRLRRYRGELHSVAHSAYLPELAERFDLNDLRSLPMAEILARAGAGIHSMKRRMGVAQAPAMVAAALHVTLTDPLLLVTFTLQDRHDQVIEWVRIYLHPAAATPEETMYLDTGKWSAAAPL